MGNQYQLTVGTVGGLDVDVREKSANVPFLTNTTVTDTHNGITVNLKPS